MGKSDLAPSYGGWLDRRRLLQAFTAVGALGLIGGRLGGVAYADALTKEQRAKMTPEDIIAMMKKGNERFRKGERKDRNYLREQRASAKGQYPAAVILSCIDSRAPAEVILDLGIGDVFNARVAGNVENEDILGSMEFGCKVAPSRAQSTTCSWETSPACSRKSNPPSTPPSTPASGRARTTPSWMPSLERMSS
jgi:carbonic anhydrase